MDGAVVVVAVAGEVVVGVVVVAAGTDIAVVGAVVDPGDVDGDVDHAEDAFAAADGVVAAAVAEAVVADDDVVDVAVVDTVSGALLQFCMIMIIFKLEQKSSNCFVQPSVRLSLLGKLINMPP